MWGKVLKIRFWSLFLLAIGYFGFVIHSGQASQVHRQKSSEENLPKKNLPKKTLEEAFFAAFTLSETIDIQKELFLQADEGFSQALGVMLPTVSGSYSFLQQAHPLSATGAAISPSVQHTAKIMATQPLFRGMKDFSSLRQRKFLVGAQIQSYYLAARQLFYDLSTAYYNVLSYQSDEQNYEIEIQMNLKRLSELEKFYQIGRSQWTDVLTFKSNIASLEAQLEVTRGQLSVAKEVLSYLTGWKEEVLLEDDEKSFHKIENLDFYLSKIEDRSEVKLALENVRANEESSRIALGQHFPSVDLVGDYYFTRPGALNNVNWDVQLLLSFPIFQGGVVQSQVRQAQSVIRQYDRLLSQARRSADQEIRTFYAICSADLKQQNKLKELVSISKQNEETQIKYYRNGLVTNLDVLTSITTSQDAKRQKDHQNFMLRLDQVKLEAATGQRLEAVVTKPNLSK